jgi:hypothetical protein
MGVRSFLSFVWPGYSGEEFAVIYTHDARVIFPKHVLMSDSLDRRVYIKG